MKLLVQLPLIGRVFIGAGSNGAAHPQETVGRASPGPGGPAARAPALTPPPVTGVLETESHSVIGRLTTMTDRPSPTAVLREGPRALSDEQVREIEESNLADVLKVDIDDVIEYVHKDLKTLPDFTTLYRRYLKQRWDVYDLDFSQDVVDWTE